MNFNLISEKWIPVACADGSRKSIAPWELTRGDPPLVDLAPPRPDFRAALMELLVGLLQTALAPARNKDWRRLLAQPPSPDELRDALAPHAPYFNLIGDKPLFMQDFTLEPPKKISDCNDVAALLIDSPGGQTLRNNADHFVKRGGVETLCPACAAMALYTLQTFAPSGGKGHRTSLRGGGPLSTLIERKPQLGSQQREPLWEKLWLNVLPASTTFARLGGVPRPTELPGMVYPWAAPTRTSEQGETTGPTDVHPLQAFWGMPRRILLLPEDTGGEIPCSLCAQRAPHMVRRYFARPYGTNFGDTWRHPLTPYRAQGSGKPTLAVKGMASIAGYGHWLGIVYGNAVKDPKGADKGVLRAACVENALCRLDTGEGEAPPRLDVAVAGYDMDNAKAKQWCEARFPYYSISGVRRDEDGAIEDSAPLDAFLDVADKLVQATENVRRNLVGQLKEALVNEAGRNQAKTDKTRFESVGAALWRNTEADFYDIAAMLADDPDWERSLPLREDWSCVLYFAARALFEEATARGRVNPERIRRTVEAGRRLDNYNRKTMRDILGLPRKGGTR